MSIEEKLKHIKEKLSKYSAVKNDDKVNQYLDELKKFSVNSDLLMNTGLGMFVKELRKHNRPYSSKAAKMVDDWKKLISKEATNNNNTNNSSNNNNTSSSKKVSANGQQQKQQTQNNSVNSNASKKRKSTTNEHEQQKKQKLTLSDYIQKKGDQLQKSSTSLTGEDDDEVNGDVDHDDDDDDFDCFNEQESNSYNPSNVNLSNEFDEFTNKIQKQLEKQKQQMENNKNRDNSSTTIKKSNPAPPPVPDSHQQQHKAKKPPTSSSNNDRIISSNSSQHSTSTSSHKTQNPSSNAKPPSKPHQPQQQSKQQTQSSQKPQQPKIIEPPKPSLPLPNLSLPTPTIEITTSSSQSTTQNLNNNKSTTTLVTQSQPIKINSNTDISKYLNSRQSKRLLYTGKRDGPIVVPKLKEICLKTLGDCIDDLPQRIYLCNINSNYEFRVAFDLIKPVLDRANFKQLMNIESYSPDFMEHTDKLWRNLCEEEFKGARPDEDETWRELFLRMHDEREAKFQLARSRVSSQQANKPIERKTQILTSVSKPHSRSAAFIPLTKTTTTKSNKFGVQQTVTVNKSKPQVSSKPIIPHQSKPTGSLMQKTLKMMKIHRR